MSEAQPIGLLRHPGRVIVLGLAVVVAVGTLLLSLPMATTAGTRTRFEDALFTATSAVCVTGLATVDTGAHWSTFGEVTILALIQVGGLGIMTVATLIVMLLSRALVSAYATSSRRRRRPCRQRTCGGWCATWCCSASPSRLWLRSS